MMAMMICFGFLPLLLRRFPKLFRSWLKSFGNRRQIQGSSQVSRSYFGDRSLGFAGVAADVMSRSHPGPGGELPRITKGFDFRKLSNEDPAGDFPESGNAQEQIIFGAEFIVAGNDHLDALADIKEFLFPGFDAALK